MFPINHGIIHTVASRGRGPYIGDRGGEPRVKHGRTASRSPALTLVHFKQYRGHWRNVWVKYLHHLKNTMLLMMLVKYTKIIKLFMHYIMIEIVCGGRGWNFPVHACSSARYVLASFRVDGRTIPFLATTSNQQMNWVVLIVSLVPLATVGWRRRPGSHHRL
jgi:hypothetical protein